MLEMEGTQIPPGAEEGPLFLKRTEYLDAISILKRVLGRKRAGDVPSTSQMAAEAILPIARRNNPEAVRELEQMAKRAPGPLDIGDLMFPTRVQEEIETGSARLRAYLQERLSQIDALRREVLGCLSPVLSECPSYYVILTADGDRMGQLIRQQQTPEQHRQLSARLAEFAKKTEEIVRHHKGYQVYAGGDDLLALLPVNTALDCAVVLADTFRQHIKGSLSIGIATAHRMEILQEALQWAREAQTQAKAQRNALSIALHTRGGAPVLAVTSFEKDPYLESWTRWIKAFRVGLTYGFPYELLFLAREAENASLGKNSLRAEALRIFERKQGRESRGHTPQIRQYLLEEIDALECADDLRRFAQRLVIARFLAGYPNGEVQS
ncbi:MAG: type III-B CRISPR-associated protein Cas10/Cmr2 [Armatimonadota bacterium]